MPKQRTQFKDRANGYVGLDGSGNADMNDGRITSLGDPTAAQDAATKTYVDAVASGLDPKNACRLATAAALPANTRTGNVLTASANGALANIDGVAAAVADRILVKNEATGANNGIYTVTDLGSASTPWVLTRATDADSSAEVTSGLYVLITAGTVNAGYGYVLTTADPITLNTTALTFTVFSAIPAGSAGGDLSGSYPNPTAKQASGDWTYAGVLTPATIGANQDDYNPTGLSTATVLRLASDASRNITGIAGGASGRVLLIANVGAQNIVLVHDATSTAANRFYCPNGINFTLLPNTKVELVYDATSSRWRFTGAPTDDVAANPSLRTLGTGAAQACAGNDSRLSDSRAPNGSAGGDLGGTFPSPTVAQASAAFAVPGDISPAAIAANTDDYNPTGLSTATVLRLSTDASRNLTGIQGGADGRILVVMNVGTNNLVLVHDATSTLGNRFYCPNAINKTLLPNTFVILVYDSTSSRWRVIGSPTDDVAANPSLRTLGTGAAQAAAGNHTHATSPKNVYFYHNPILAGTNYLPLGGTNSGLEVKTTCPAAFTLRNLRIQLRTAPGVGNTVTVTLRRNGVNTSVTASIADSNTTGSDLVNTQAYSAGDDISIAIVLNAGAPADLTISWEEDYTTS